MYKNKSSPHVAENRMGTAFYFGDPGGIRTPDPRLRRPGHEMLTERMVGAFLNFVCLVVCLVCVAGVLFCRCHLQGFFLLAA